MSTTPSKPDNPDVLGTDPIVPGMRPDPLPEDPDVLPADDAEHQDGADADEDSEASRKTPIGPIDLA
ncbi:hypothetical protein [Bordetella sp. N]|uniref:hypothetical protein n=1 Tax=Bordetella sp. N TaxID=1746199 RepID=UPI0007098DAB|nr:hypothetical protein [Bordetella sp. N]ALM84609.1 hypothetical protein ASB57_17940 [Bordetella sp. N]